MKMKTAIRLISLAVTLVVIVVAVMPIVDMIGESNDSSVGSEAVFVLDYMDEDTLRSNIDAAIDGKEGCAVEYGDRSIPVNTGNIDSVSRTVKDSGAEKAIVRDSGGNVVIMGAISYGTSTVTGVGMDICFPGMVGDALEVGLEIHIKSADEKVSFVSDTPDGMRAGSAAIMPYVFLYLLEAYGCSTTVVVQVGYEKLISVDINVENGVLAEGSYRVDRVDGRTIMTAYSSYDIGNISGTVGDVSVGFNGGTMSLECEGDISDALKGSLDGGRLTVTMPDSSYTMSERMSESFISAVDIMEGSA